MQFYKQRNVFFFELFWNYKNKKILKNNLKNVKVQVSSFFKFFICDYFSLDYCDLKILNI